MADTPSIDNPFGPDDFDRLEEALANTQKIERAIAKARQAGLDVGDAQERNRANADQLRRIKQTYFPGR